MGRVTAIEQIPSEAERCRSHSDAAKAEVNNQFWSAFMAGRDEIQMRKGSNPRRRAEMSGSGKPSKAGSSTAPSGGRRRLFPTRCLIARAVA